ncbi:30S ribosomal protein S20 [Clostridia bacterium]|nr:30S ribosomal protein S20 [Clostridia bacterium]
MPNIKSAKKRASLANEKQLKNASAKANMRNRIQAYRDAVANDADNKQELLVSAISSIDKAAKNKLIHKRTADRKKSRLEKALNA